MAKHVVSVVLLWAALTAVGEALVFADLFPTVGSHEAEDFDQIFRVLLFMGIPVFNFVVAMLVHSFLRFRAGGPQEGGATFKGTGAIPKVWLLLTSCLAVTTIIYPGLTGLRKLQSEANGYGWADTKGTLIIHVQAFQWGWQYDYQEYDGEKLAVSVFSLHGDGNELVLPLEVGARFEINSTGAAYDFATEEPSSGVLHSFWIPAFRMKIDAIPGRTTTMTVKPTELGDYGRDPAYRVQCAELCGLSHTTMDTPVRVVSQEEFKTWLAEQAKATKK
ncbi:MAG: hypothetical protein C0506_11675 [Anaerolinea sp.]|nr:hypothetical protein [Anaerolinea sp.]